MEGVKPHIVILASPGMGHLNPNLALSKRLVSLHSVRVTVFLITTPSASSRSLIQSSQLPDGLELVTLPPVDISPFVTSSTTVLTTRLSIMVRESLSALKSEIVSMTPPPSALIVDLFGMAAYTIADEVGIPKYVFVTSSAWFLALTMYTPTLDHQVEGEYVDQPKPIQIPGCRPIQVDDVVDPMLVRADDSYKVYLDMCLAFQTADGLILNTWEDLEPRSLTALREDPILRQIVTPRLFPVGPLVKTEEEMNETSIMNECFDWLDRQPKESVLYVSFGSGGTLSHEQVNELAWGLELSQKRFLWVVRPPVQQNASGAFFSGGSGQDEPSDYLPEGFFTRVQGIGMVVADWAPQVNILKHPSTGGFLSHCGWNSTLESIINGVPMIVWPLYAEQRLNATALAEEFEVAIRTEVLPMKKVVSREEIEKMVRGLMEEKEGEVIRARMKDLQTGAVKAIEQDGSSCNTLRQLVADFVK